MLVDELFKEMSSLEAVEAIALGGSRAGEDYDEKSDYDVYVYCTGDIARLDRERILTKYCSVMEIGNHFWELEDDCTLNNGIDIDIIYRNLEDFANDIAEVVENYQPHNGYTTCMWHNLRTCKILYDKNSRLEAIKKRFDIQYPKKLKANIVERNRTLLRGSLPAYETQLLKAVKRRDLVSINHRMAAFFESYFDIIFAINEITHPGEKRLVGLCKKRCKILPNNFEENIEKLFEDLFTNYEKIETDLNDIIMELDKIIQKI